MVVSRASALFCGVLEICGIIHTEGFNSMLRVHASAKPRVPAGTLPDTRNLPVEKVPVSVSLCVIKDYSDPVRALPARLRKITDFTTPSPGVATGPVQRVSWPRMQQCHFGVA